MQAHSARARLPEMPLGATHSGKFLPRAAAVRCLEQGRVFRSSVNGIRVGRRGFEMPNAFEFPGVLRAVVPLVSAGNAVVVELVSDRFPLLCRHHRSAGSFDRTSRWSVRQTTDPVRRAIP